LILQIRGCAVSGSKAAYWKAQYDLVYAKYQADEIKIEGMIDTWSKERAEYDGMITGLNGVLGGVQTEREQLTESNAIKSNEIRALREKAKTDVAAKDSLIRALDERIVILENTIANADRAIQVWKDKYEIKDREFKTLEVHFADLTKAYVDCGAALKVANTTIKWQNTRIKTLEFQVNLGKVGIGVGVAAGLVFLLKK
jgi:chromosome segregation ATPase